MADFVARCVGCGRTVGDAVPAGARPGLPVDWTYDLADGRTRDVHDFCCGDCLRETVAAATGRRGERVACPVCGGSGTHPEKGPSRECGQCEDGLVHGRPPAEAESGQGVEEFAMGTVRGLVARVGERFGDDDARNAALAAVGVDTLAVVALIVADEHGGDAARAALEGALDTASAAMSSGGRTVRLSVVWEEAVRD